MFAAHFVVNAGDVLGAAHDVGLDARTREFTIQNRQHVLDVAFAVDALVVEQARDLLVGVRLKNAKREVFELPLQLPHTQAIGQRRENIARQLRAFTARGGVFTFDRVTQILRVIGKLNQHHPHVLHHRQQHLAQRFELRGLLVGLLPAHLPIGQRADGVHAQHAFGEISNRCAEFIAHAFRRSSVQLQHRPQQRRRHGLVTQMQVTEQRHRAHHMRQHRLAIHQRLVFNQRRDKREHLAQLLRGGGGFARGKGVDPRGCIGSRWRDEFEVCCFYHVAIVANPAFHFRRTALTLCFYCHR